MKPAPVLIQKRNYGVFAIYLSMVVFGVLQTVQRTPLVASLTDHPNYIGLSIWASLIAGGAGLSCLGAWVAPKWALEGLSPVRPLLFEAVGAWLLFIAFFGFHAAIIVQRGWTAVPTSQVLVGSWWLFSGACGVQKTIEAVSAHRARRRGTTVSVESLGVAPPEG